MTRCRRARRIVAAVAVLGAVIAAGCGSSSSSNSSSGASTAGASGGGAASAGVSQAKSFVSTHTATPTSLFVTQPLAKTPPTGKSIVWVQCALPVCTLVGDGVEAGAKALGWKFSRVDEGSTPDQIAKAWNQVVQMHPDGVAQGGIPRALFQPELNQLKAAGIPYVGGSVLDPLGGGMIADIGAAPDYVERGQWMARWVVAQTNGKANTAMFNIPDFPVLVQVQKSFEAEYKRLCPTCGLSVVTDKTTDIGRTIPGQVVSEVQRNPKLNYLVFGVGDMTIGVPEALQSANLAGQVKIVSQASGPINFKHIVAGNVEAAAVPEPDVLSGWEYVDALARAFTGTPVKQSVYDTFPRQYLTKDNISNPAVPYVGVPGYQSKFKSLWHVQ